MNEDYISIGKILNFHGINGEVKVGFSKGKENQLKSTKVFFVKKEGVYTKLKVKSLRFHKNFALIKFDGINSIDDTLEYKGSFLFVETSSVRKNLERDEFLVDDLVNLLAVSTNDEVIGRVVAVNKYNTSSDLLVVETQDGKEHLIPFVKELVPVVDLKSNKIVINVIEGLLD